ncbi:MAG: polyketide cyclase [Ramlibacter sp.]|jgi:cyclase|nr:polyketide cyclase [Ramlibacter sp.]
MLRRTALCLAFGLTGLLLAPSTAFADAPVWDANKVQLAPQQLAPGVWAMVPTGADQLSPKGVPLATTAGVIVGSRASLVVDTMLNKRLADMVLAHARKVHGGKAPAFAVNTSYHGDHSYGNMYLPASTVIIQHATTKDYVDKSFEADTKFMIGAFGKGRGIEQIQPRTGSVLVPKGGALLLDLGGKQVELRDFGFAQTGGDLWVWIPQDKILFAGNPVVTEKPGIPWLLDGHVQESLDTLVRVKAFLPAGATIVPGHGRRLPKDGLDWHIAYLQELRDQVKAAVDRGESVEQVVASVPMTNFRGYGIFDWIHKQVNVPAAYKEFKKP